DVLPVLGVARRRGVELDGERGCAVRGGGRDDRTGRLVAGEVRDSEDLSIYVGDVVERAIRSHLQIDDLARDGRAGEEGLDPTQVGKAVRARDLRPDEVARRILEEVGVEVVQPEMLLYL